MVAVVAGEDCVSFALDLPVVRRREVVLGTATLGEPVHFLACLGGSGQGLARVANIASTTALPASPDRRVNSAARLSALSS